MPFNKFRTSKTGIATFSLDTGKCPKWLFERMKKMAGLMSEIIIEEFGEEDFLKKISDPYWFQAFGCALAFDWNSSGLTILTTAALKESLRERDLGIYVCGGKGKTSKKTPDELLKIGEKIGMETAPYINLSRLTAKIDNSLIQDGFNIYHHSFILTKSGNWAVIQQGMNTNISQARRYHWGSLTIPSQAPVVAHSSGSRNLLSRRFCSAKDGDQAKTASDKCPQRNCLLNNKIEMDLALSIKNSKDFTTEPHTGIVSDIRLKNVLNLTHKESIENKNLIVALINTPQDLIKDLKFIDSRSRPQKSLFLPNVEFHKHPVMNEKFDVKRLKKTIGKASFLEPKNIEELLLIKGVGPRTIRAVSLIGELIYNKNVSKIDPARYSFTHGGKDGTPYFVDRETYDQSIEILKQAINKAKIRMLKN